MGEALEAWSGQRWIGLFKAKPVPKQGRGKLKSTRMLATSWSSVRAQFITVISCMHKLGQCNKAWKPGFLHVAVTINNKLHVMRVGNANQDSVRYSFMWPFLFAEQHGGRMVGFRFLQSNPTKSLNQKILERLA